MYTRTYVTPYSFSGTFSATFSCFVMGNIFFAFLDYFQWPTFLYKYKIQTGKNTMPDQKKIVKLIKGVTTNLVISFVLMELSWPTVSLRRGSRKDALTFNYLSDFSTPVGPIPTPTPCPASGDSSAICSRPFWDTT